MALSIEDLVLADARNHDVAALNALYKTANQADLAAQDAVLAQPGAFDQIIAVLTKTHPAQTDGYSWPGFLLSAGAGKTDQADEQVFGISKYSDYRGVEVIIYYPFGAPGPQTFHFGGITAYTPPTTTTTTPSGSALPGAPPCIAGPSGPKVRPKLLYLACGDGNISVTGLTWKGWAPLGATATGTLHVNTCNPSCVAGNYKTYPNSFVYLTVPGTFEGSKVFTNISVTPPNDPKAEVTSKYPGAWGWA